MKKIPIINQIIKDKRKEMKITQQEFTNLINKAISTVRRYDTGDIIPENTLILICDILNLSISQLAIKQAEENDIVKTNYYQELINKYVIAETTEFLDSTKLIEKKVYKEKNFSSKNEKIESIDLKYYGDQLEKLYSILYNDMYTIANPENSTTHLFLENEDIKNYKYICEQDFNMKKNIIKEVIFYKDGTTKEKNIDSFSIEESFELLNELSELFSIKILTNRKVKLLGSYKKRMKRIKKVVFGEKN